MTATSASAFVGCQLAIAAALIEMEAMKAANEERRRHDKADAYGESDFLTVQQNMIERVNNERGWIQQ